MPSTSLRARKTRKIKRKKIVVVAAARRASGVKSDGQVGGSKSEKGMSGNEDGNADRPRARRTIWSMWLRAAVVDGDEVADASVRDVGGKERGRGSAVARNMW